MTFPGCPDGMYPMDVDYAENEFETFAELKREVEEEFTHDSLNLPISWYFNTEPQWDNERGEYNENNVNLCFDLVFLMPRKYGKTFSYRTFTYNRAEVQEWLDTWVREQINHWFGWN